MKRSHLCAGYVLLFILALAAISGCSAVDRLEGMLYPSPTPAPEQRAEPTLAPATPADVPAEGEPTAAKPTATAVADAEPAEPEPTVPATSEPQPTGGVQPAPSEPVQTVDSDQHLVYAINSGIFRGDYLGAEPEEVASVLQLEAYDFFSGSLAIARGLDVEVIDLNRSLLQGIEVEVEGEVTYADVLWSTTGRSLLYVATVQDDAAATGRRVELRALAMDGAEFGRTTLDDATGANVLRYDDVQGQVLLIPLGDSASFSRADLHDLATGEVVQTMSISGEGQAIASPDGRYLLTQWLAPDEGASVAVYDLSPDTQGTARQWKHPTQPGQEGTFGDSHVWSHDGRYVAYMLREGSISETPTSLGVWVLDVSTMEATEILVEDGVSSTLVAWSPDDAYIIGHRRSQEGDAFFYAVRPDGGERHILGLEPDSSILGWMTTVGEPVRRVVVDPWKLRFLDAAGDAASVPGIVAEFVSAEAELDSEALSLRVGGYLQQAGLSPELVQPTVMRLSEELSLAQLPDFAIYALDKGQASPLVRGDVLLDARLDGDAIGLVFGVVGASSVQPAYSLFRRNDEGAWTSIWLPQGQRDWIATDGEIRFAGEGTSVLEVRGSSFGLDLAEDQVFVECHACPHRWLTGTWVRTDDAYVRKTELPPDAALSDIHWEMTERDAYAIVNESLRRMRRGLPTQGLVTGTSVLEQARSLDLLEPGVRLIADIMDSDSVRFASGEEQAPFIASIADGQLVSIARVDE